MPGAGGRDVDEAAFLVVVPVGQLGLVGLKRQVEVELGVVADDIEIGQLGPVAAERIGQFAEPQPSARIARGGGQALLGQVGNGDEIPFEALGAVNGQQLHGALLRQFSARAEIVLQFGPFEPAQKARQCALLVAVEKGRDGVVEGIQVGQAEVVGLVRDQLDVEPKFLLDQAYKVEQRQTGPGAQPGQLASGRLHPGPAEVAEPGELAVRVGC